VQQHLPLEEYSSHMPCRAYEQLRRMLAVAVPWSLTRFEEVTLKKK
jgi:hypothetical protein